jgi:cell division septation protein DedD
MSQLHGADRSQMSSWPAVVLVVASVSAASVALGLTVVGPMLQRQRETPAPVLALNAAAPVTPAETQAPLAEVQIKERVIPRPKPKPAPAEITLPLGAPVQGTSDLAAAATPPRASSRSVTKPTIHAAISDADGQLPPAATDGAAADRKADEKPRADLSVSGESEDRRAEALRSHETVIPRPRRRLSPLDALPALGSSLPKGQSLGGDAPAPSSASGSVPDSRADGKETPAGADTGVRRSYRVQVGRFVNETDARRLRDELTGSGLSPRVVRTEKDGTVLYRVQVGTFRQKENAERQIEKLKSQSYEPYLAEDEP